MGVWVWLLLCANGWAGTPLVRVESSTGYPKPDSLLARTGAWTAGPGSWIACRLSRRVTNLVLSWDDRTEAWADSFPKRSCCGNLGPTHPVSYQIQGSWNSTNGVDGDWTKLLAVEGNQVQSRLNEVVLEGRQWVRFVQSEGFSRLDELLFYDADSLAGDTWFFIGNSITQDCFKRYRIAPAFSDLVAASDPDRSPAIIRGGISGVKAWEVATALPEYGEFSSGAKYWAIELGTNDMWSRGIWGLPDYKDALTKIVAAAFSNGAVPIIARIIPTDSSRAKWQVADGYLQAVDSITAAYGLPIGPDFHSWFLAHPEEFRSDGIHPNEIGAASIHRMWAEVALRLRARRSSSRTPGVVRSKAFLHVFGAGGDRGANVDAAGRPYSVGSGVGYLRRWNE